MDKKYKRKSSSSHSSSRSRSRSSRKHSKKNYKKRSRKYSRSSSSSFSQQERKQKRNDYNKKNEPVQQSYNPKIADSKCIEEKFKDICTDCKVYPPEEIKYVGALSTAYITFSSSEPARKILLILQGQVNLNGHNFPVEFYPMNLLQTKREDVNMVQDWLCERCSFHNFARRQKCHKCEHPRSSHSKVVYNGACLVRHYPEPYQNANRNTSLMIRGNIITKCNQTMLLEIFNQLAAIKDIRTVVDKNTKQFKDFVFIEFYTVDEAELVLRACQAPDFLVYGERIHATFSKKRNQRDEEGDQNQYEEFNNLYPYDSGYQPNDFKSQNAQNQAYNYTTQQQQQQYQQYYQQQQLMHQYHQYYNQQSIQETILPPPQPQAQKPQSLSNHQQHFQQMQIQQQQNIKQSNINREKVAIQTLQPGQGTKLPEKVMEKGKEELKQTELRSSLVQETQVPQPGFQKLVDNTKNIAKQELLQEKKIKKISRSSSRSQSPTSSEERKAQLQKDEEQKNQRKQIENQLKKWEKEQQTLKKTSTFQIQKKVEPKITFVNNNKLQNKIIMNTQDVKVEKKKDKNDIKFYCLPCKRKFKLEGTLNKHNLYSKMHQNIFNLIK